MNDDARERGLGEVHAPFTATPSLQREKGVWVKIGPGGRIVIPAPMRKALGLGEGDHVVIYAQDDQLNVVPKDVALRRVQDLVARYAPDDGTSWVDELLEERRREVEREERGE